jgi:hypothetical protein
MALVYESGFFGLIASGWDIEDTTGKGARGGLPAQALEVERIVGLFDAERASGVPLTAEEFNRFSPRALADDDLENVRALRQKLFDYWFATPPGQTMELTFAAGSEK